MKRIYFLVPSVELAHAIVDELLLARVEERHIHILAKVGTPLGDLPEASLFQKSDFIPAMERGLAIGGITGTMAGLVAVALPTGMVLGGGAVLAIALAGAGIGSWLAGMIGLDVENSRLKNYQSAVEKGELLLMVDVPRERVEEIHQRVQKHHPEAEFEGTEPTIPAFP
ncbi:MULTISPECIES: hypothetical protein [Methylococcus]|jgi:hypothetical protein|uniref:DUF1269 domain-containing protein n=1 Tax=Methylococcus capsulatus (strain ATCC 33009 / NCIMB 11132 / Bath) TaxID=243233 RepID=Q603M7_METCA|nr:hypothetical protein [Methylococcus capsulatus]AAU91124.1 conserved hypothetical protein [Methylococcus capsulatus str. Bath]QXP86743.1 DUF1269 domain-containing protein [Methylococcus capsulatus]QXP91931.1 DUF1269 domain-containing protein [Methylococcus capsulatus]QXP93579.1 DUF1269 domain-containing protein [Methylococcus capsulatus]UQN11713.1 DUF1269 domain-containing protein [Methylococcus capsulatus]